VVPQHDYRRYVSTSKQPYKRSPEIYHTQIERIVMVL